MIPESRARTRTTWCPPIASGLDRWHGLGIARPGVLPPASLKGRFPEKHQDLTRTLLELGGAPPTRMLSRANALPFRSYHNSREESNEIDEIMVPGRTQSKHAPIGGPRTSPVVPPTVPYNHTIHSSTHPRTSEDTSSHPVIHHVHGACD